MCYNYCINFDTKKGGEYMQKILSTIVLSVMLVAGLGIVMSPSMVSAAVCTGGAAVGTMQGTPPVACTAAASTNNDISATSLGLYYGADTGLGSKDVRTTIASIIRTAMSLLGIVAVVIILIGGFTWMTAGGNEEKVGEAKKWIFSGIIGLAIILSAYALASFVITQLVTATLNP